MQVQGSQFVFNRRVIIAVRDTQTPEAPSGCYIVLVT